jgi:hypothetical protein
MGSGPVSIGGGCHRPRPERVGRYSISPVSQTRPKAAVRGGAKVRPKSGRRPPVRVKSGPELPLLPIVVGGILVVLAVVIIIYSIAHGQGAKGPTVASAAGIPCDQLEHTQVHYHAAVQIIDEGVLHPIPAGIGIVTDSSGNVTCYYWLHVHPQYPDVIHIESPASDKFTLGQFFSVWSAWGGKTQPLDSTQVSTITLTPAEKLYTYIDASDGKGPQLFTGDPKTIVLTKHEVISLEITSGTPTTPPAFDWNSSTNAGL